MIMHIVTFSWHAGTTDDQVTELTHALDALAPLVPELRSYRHGPDMGLRESNADYAVAATLDTPEQLPDYLEHPEHVRIVRKILTPMLAHRQAVQIAVPAAPGSHGLGAV